MKRSIMIAIVISLLILSQGPGWARRDYFTPEQKSQLAKIQTILVEAVALTDKGAVDAGPIRAVVVSRLSELGYTVITDGSKPYDVMFKVKCEQRKTWEGTASAGGDADLPDSPSRVWKGPACQLNYTLGGMKIKWQKEVRTDFEDAIDAAQKANAGDPGDYAMKKLTERLTNYDFPVTVTADWGQDERLLKLLDSSKNQMRRLKIISLLGEMLSDSALPRLKEALKDKDLAKQAAESLGNIGREGIPLLIDILKNSPDMDLRISAVKGLGQVGGLHGDTTAVVPLLEVLKDPNTDWTLLTEVAWSLGKMPDKRSIEPLYALDRKLQAMRDPENMKLKKLKEAVFWAIKQCDTWDQYS
ncbi:MAG TPA: HEAT repeat domain-containing protein [Nitrospiraceae bacterium]|nr:HEAT repeat domain-containing protein [Nitrospiraceae bacterium]